MMDLLAARPLPMPRLALQFRPQARLIEIGRVVVFAAERWVVRAAPKVRAAVATAAAQIFAEREASAAGATCG